MEPSDIGLQMSLSIELDNSYEDAFQDVPPYFVHPRPTLGRFTLSLSSAFPSAFSHQCADPWLDAVLYGDAGQDRLERGGGAGASLQAG